MKEKTNKCVRQLRLACAKIVRQNRALLRRLAAEDFNAADELDCTANKAQFYLTDFFDALSLFRHGEVPSATCKSTLRTTADLIAAICEKYAYSREIVAAARTARIAFQCTHRLWGSKNPIRRLSPEAYRQELEDGRDDFLVALNLLNRDLALYAKVPRLEKKKGPRARREVEGELTQAQVAEDFGVARQTINGWEKSGKPNKYGYYAALRTDPARRGDYYRLVNRVAAFNRWVQKEKSAGRRAAISFVSFNENVDSYALAKLP